MDQKANPQAFPDVLAFMCRHVVALAWYEGLQNANGQFTKPPTFYGASGFVLLLGNAGCLVTAGHVLADHDKRKESDGIVRQHVSIVDGWGQSKPTTIPFDFFDTDFAFIAYDESAGLDFAVIPMPENTFALVSKTTEPIKRADWISQDKMTFDFYAIVGFPNELAIQGFETTKGMNYIQTRQSPVMIAVERCRRRPKEVAKTKYPRFIGRLADRSKGKIGHVQGMSGGPIFGFRKSDGQVRYWPVAVQSGYLESSRIITACPLPTIGGILDDLLANGDNPDPP